MTIQEILPHRKPFLFVDEISRADKDKIVGSKTFSEDEFFFTGHFPGYPVVPGVLLVEAMAQCGGAGIRKAGIVNKTAIYFLVTVDKAKFRRQVLPNELVRMEITNLRVTQAMMKQKGKAFVGGELAVEASWMALIKEDVQQ